MKGMKKLVIKCKVWNESEQKMYNFEQVKLNTNFFIKGFNTFGGVYLPIGNPKNYILFYTGKNDYYGVEIYTHDLIMVSGNNKEPIVGVVEFGEYFQDEEMHIGFYIKFENKALKKNLGYWVNKCKNLGSIYTTKCNRIYE
ncbi:yopX family protein [Clostridioides difficile CD160]|nr:yopX family protein [Clostridioides difficile CD160]